VSGFCEHGNELLGFIKGRQFMNSLIDYKLLKNSAA
jgi:hypothetical protein